MLFNHSLKLYQSLLLSLAFVPLTSCSMDFPWSQKEPQPLAQPLPVDDKPKRMAIGSTSVVGVKADGTVWSWGNGSYGALGDGQAYSRQATPTQIPNMTNFMEVATGGYHYLALRKDGTVWSWGDNKCGQLGYETEPELTGWDKKPSGETYSATPKQIKELKDVISVAAGYSYSVALTKSGDVYTFGCNEFGQLGLGYVDETKNNKKVRYVVPQKVGNVPDAIKADANVSDFFIITKNKELFIGGIIYSKNKKKSYPIVLTKINFIEAVDASLGFYDIYILNDKGFLYRVGLEDMVENKLITENPELINRGDTIINVQYSFEGYMVLNSKKKIYHIYQGSKWSIPNIENISELYSANGLKFAALTTDGNVYFWGDYSHGIRGLGNPHDLGTRYLAATTKRGKTPELSLWHWK